MKKKYYVFPLAVSSCLTLQAEHKDKKIEKPNVIFIYADDIGYGDISCNGAQTIRTPNIDRLAAEGVRFTNVHSAAATSTPSRYALLTGEYAWRRKGTGIAAGDAALIIRPDRYTLADMFKQAGYATGVVGKWHLGLGDRQGAQNWNEQLTPGTRDIGFDYAYIMAATGDRVPCVFVENDCVVGVDPYDPIEINYHKNFAGEPTGRENPELLNMHPSHGHDQSIVNGISRIGFMKGGKNARWKDEEIGETLTNKALTFIEENKDKPFFLYFATQDAHVPRVPGPRFAGKSGMGVRGDCVLQFDWSVGEVLTTLERLNLLENTIIVISSDNGPVIDDGYKDQAIELLGEHKPSGDFRGGKYSSYEAGTRVPCILSWKGVTKPTETDALLCQIDWFASFAEMLHIRIPKNAAPDSEPLLRTWLGKNRYGRSYLVLQNFSNNLSITDGKWKYIRPSKDISYMKQVSIETGNSVEPQLYHLKKDIGEQTNKASQNKKRLKILATELERIIDGRYGQSLSEF